MSEPILVMTLMVRDEADIIAAMLEHHLAQGIDRIIVTDNGSIDGTRAILAEYARTGRVEVHDYLQHDKNQTRVVSEMASRAATVHGATWVINADADEFFRAVNPELTLRDALSAMPTGIGSFPVPVVNMTGTPARSGPALDRLTFRDERDESTLMSTVALHAHPTPDVIHVGRAGVTVQQGNHGVDIPQLGEPDPALAIEVLHFPWRSYGQYSTKIMNTGRSYDANPTLNPSPRHHGMRDYRFWKAGVLESLYIARHPLANDDSGFVSDDRLLRELRELLRSGGAIHPESLGALLEGPVSSYTDDELTRARAVAAIVVPLEVEHLTASTAWRDMYRGQAAGRRRAEAEAAEARTRLDQVLNRPEARARHLVGRVLRGVRRRVGG